MIGSTQNWWNGGFYSFNPASRQASKQKVWDGTHESFVVGERLAHLCLKLPVLLHERIEFFAADLPRRVQLQRLLRHRRQFRRILPSSCTSARTSARTPACTPAGTPACASAVVSVSAVSSAALSACTLQRRRRRRRRV